MKSILKLILLVLFAFIFSCGNKFNEEHTDACNEDSLECGAQESYKEDKKDCCKKPETSQTSEITCPNCAFKKVETLPTEVCQLSYTCENCKIVMHPKEDDCCVFCTYGDHKCPSMQ